MNRKSHSFSHINFTWVFCSLSLSSGKKSGSAFRMLLFVLAFLNDILLIKVITHYFVDSGNLCIYIYVWSGGGVVRCEVWNVSVCEWGLMRNILCKSTILCRRASSLIFHNIHIQCGMFLREWTLCVQCSMFIQHLLHMEWRS